MGPHAFACGNLGGESPQPRRRGASMGPHAFACGNRIIARQVQIALTLQWGRTLLRAETRLYVRVRWARDARFNGAARFCVRKLRTAAWMLTLCVSFNG